VKWEDSAVDINQFHVYLDPDLAVGRVELNLSFTSEGVPTANFLKVKVCSASFDASRLTCAYSDDDLNSIGGGCIRYDRVVLATFAL